MSRASLLSTAVLLIALLAAPVARAMEVERVVSPGGIEAWLVQDHSNPLIAVDIAFEGAGAAADPDGKDGLAEFASSVIDEGSGDLDSQAFQGMLDDYNIKLSFGAGLDNFNGSLQTLSENRDRAFDLLRTAMTEPRFDAEPVERIRSQLVIGATRDQRNPSQIASRNLQHLLYPDHPYARPTGGTPEKPVGMVCFGWSNRIVTRVETQRFKGDRQQIRRQAAEHAMRGLLELVRNEA